VSIIAQGQGLAMGALITNPQVSMHTHNYANTWKWLELYFLGFTKNRAPWYIYMKINNEMHAFSL